MIIFLFYLIIYILKINIKNNYNINEKINLNRLYLSKEFNKIYSTLYFLAKLGKAQRPFYNKKYIINKYPIKKNKGICLCTLGKNENLYAREFIEYYYLLGFDKIVIFDNNDLNDENFENVLRDYIKTKYVEIIDIRGIISVQIPVLNYCYKKYYKLFDWIAFFDFDEFLFINDFKNINNFIYNKRFEKCQSILFNWYFYDDNDLEKYDRRKINQRFKRPKIKSSLVKSMIRGNIENLIIPSSHISGININYFCNTNGIRIYPNTFYSTEFQNNYKIFIKHFYTKSAEEFCNKIKKGDVQFHKNQPNYRTIINNKLNFFFLINKITIQKIKILEKCLGINLNNYKNKYKNI